MITEQFLRDSVNREYMTRIEISEITGLITPGALANLDNLKKGISNKKKICSKVVYPIIDIVAFFENNTE